ncbi:hypothetical protein ACTFIR_003911 [Dictyostelium discoideum]
MVSSLLLTQSKGPVIYAKEQIKGVLSILELTLLDDTNSQVCPVHHLSTYLKASKGRWKPHSGDFVFIQNEGKPVTVQNRVLTEFYGKPTWHITIPFDSLEKLFLGKLYRIRSSPPSQIECSFRYASFAFVASSKTFFLAIQKMILQLTLQDEYELSWLIENGASFSPMLIISSKKKVAIAQAAEQKVQESVSFLYRTTYQAYRSS